jgi:hypothetical protein
MVLISFPLHANHHIRISTKEHHMATLNEFIELIAEELGVDADAVSIDVKEKKVVITILDEDAEDLFDEDYGLEDDEDDSASPALV